MPPSFAKYLGNSNQYTLAVWNALDGNLNVFDNLAEDRFVLVVTGGSTATTFTGTSSFKNPLATPIQDLWITRVVIVGNNIYTSNTAVIGPIDWQANSETIQINSIPGLTNGTQYQITIRFAV